MTGEIPPERPLKDRCEELIEEWRHTLYTSPTEDKTRAACAEELEALLDGEEP